MQNNTQTAVKQSCRNNPILAKVKKVFNKPIYKHALAVRNAGNDVDLLIYIGTHFNVKCRAQCVNDFAKLAH